MLNAISVFLIQYSYVLLLGLQSRHVRDSQYFSAAATSAVLGVMGLTITSSIARAAVSGGDPLLNIAYIAAGPMGIMTAIWMHDRRYGVRDS